MRSLILALAFLGLAAAAPEAQSKKAAPARKAPAARKAAPPPAVTRVQGEIACPSELGVGVRTRRRFCDILAGRDPAGGVLVTIPPHRGPVSLSFELHNRHTYSEDLVRARKAFRQYTATIGVLTLDNTLIDRAVIQSEFRTEKDLFDRIEGGAGPGGVKAVAPSGTEFITVQLPEDVGEKVSLLGEKLIVLRPEGTDTFASEGRPLATISNVMVEFRPAPVTKKPPAKAATKPPAKKR